MRAPYNRVPALREAALTVVQVEAVVAAEARLRTLWNGFRRVPKAKETSSFGEWKACWNRHVKELARQLILRAA